MKPVEELALYAYRYLRQGEVFVALALIEAAGVLWRREVRELLGLVKEGRVCDAAVLAVMMARSPWFHKDVRLRPSRGWEELSPLVETFTRGGDLAGVEAVVRLKERATWPEARWLVLLHRRLGGEISLEDLSYAARWLADRRIVVERLGMGTGKPREIDSEVKNARHQVASGS